MKKQEDLEEAKRAKQTAEYKVRVSSWMIVKMHADLENKLRDEADRALKAENDSLAKTNV